MNRPPVFLHYIYAVLLALLPWSVPCQFGSWEMELLTEPLLVIAAAALCWAIYRHGLPPRNKVLTLSVAYGLWVLVTAYFSVFPIVSIKYGLVMATHWWVFGVGFMRWPSLFTAHIKWFLYALCGLVVYTLIHHGTYGFRADQAILAPMPFFPDHTLYGAVISMAIGWCMVTMKESVRSIVVIVFCCGLLMSEADGAILATILGIALVWSAQYGWGKILTKMSMPILLTGSLTLAFFPDIFIKNSIYTPGISILERLNRYSSAGKMVLDRPIAGFGAGTYQFAYIAYQQPHQMTRISANAPVNERSIHTYGRGGGAHNEYLQALAETGWPGFLLLGLLLTTLIWAPMPKGGTNIPLLILLIFAIQAVFNNFSHDARIALLFWGAVSLVKLRDFTKT